MYVQYMYIACMLITTHKYTIDYWKKSREKLDDYIYTERINGTYTSRP